MNKPKACDMTLCMSSKCEVKEQCFRHESNRTPSKYRQSYSNFKDTKCDYFMEIEHEKIQDTNKV